jgi:hypothetical protein
MATRRYTIDFDNEFDGLLSTVAKQKGTTKSEVVRRAVASYAYLNQQISAKTGPSEQANLKVSLTDANDRVVKDVILP